MPRRKTAPKQPRVVVCVTGQKSCERLIRYGALLANQLEVVLDVVHVAKPNAPLMNEPNDEQSALSYLLEVAAENGASIAVLRSKHIIETLGNYTEENAAMALVMGSPPPGASTDFSTSLRKRMSHVDVHMLPFEG